MAFMVEGLIEQVTGQLQPPRSAPIASENVCSCFKPSDLLSPQILQAFPVWDVWQIVKEYVWGLIVVNLAEFPCVSGRVSDCVTTLLLPSLPRPVLHSGDHSMHKLMWLITWWPEPQLPCPREEDAQEGYETHYHRDSSGLRLNDIPCCDI